MSGAELPSGRPDPQELGDLEQSDVDLDEFGLEVLEPEPLALERKGWLGRLLEFYFRIDDASERSKRVERVKSLAPPEATLARLAEELAQAHLTRAQFHSTEDLLAPRVRRALRAEGAAEGPLLTVGLLTTQWDLLQEISELYGNTGGVVERALELLTVMALGLEHYKLARKLHKAHLEVANGKLVKLHKLARKVEERFAPRGQLPGAHRALGVGIGLAYLEARGLARLAAAYYERSVIEEEGLRQLNSFSRVKKIELVEVLIALAWADGVVNKEERHLIEQQIALADLDKVVSRRLLRSLEDDAGAPALDLRPLDAPTRSFVLEQAVLLSLVDDGQDPAEEALLQRIAVQLGGDAAELAQVVLGVVAFYEENRASIKGFGPVSAGKLATLRSTMGERAQAVVQGNMRRLVQEVKETGELFSLLSAASVRTLTPAEVAKVKAQLIDVCKSIPALAIFLLPGGALLLPILVKALPFNILPSAFMEPLPPTTSSGRLLPYRPEGGAGGAGGA